jgi:hypothetical protein
VPARKNQGTSLKAQKIRQFFVAPLRHKLPARLAKVIPKH